MKHVVEDFTISINYTLDGERWGNKVRTRLNPPSHMTVANLAYDMAEAALRHIAKKVKPDWSDHPGTTLKDVLEAVEFKCSEEE